MRVSGDPGSARSKPWGGIGSAVSETLSSTSNPRPGGGVTCIHSDAAGDIQRFGISVSGCSPNATVTAVAYICSGLICRVPDDMPSAKVTGSPMMRSTVDYIVHRGCSQPLSRILETALRPSCVLTRSTHAEIEEAFRRPQKPPLGFRFALCVVEEYSERLEATASHRAAQQPCCCGCVGSQRKLISGHGIFRRIPNANEPWLSIPFLGQELWRSHRFKLSRHDLQDAFIGVTTTRYLQKLSHCLIRGDP